MQRLKNYFLISMFLLLTACSGKNSGSNPDPSEITVAPQSVTTHLYYSGTIEPLNSHSIMSPVDGVVKKIYFHYGDLVQEKQLLLTISSEKSKQDYATALTNYIKDKDQYLRSKNNFDATNTLYHAGIVDQETYLSDKSQLATNELAYINSLNALKAFSKAFPQAVQHIENLKLENMAQIQSILAKQYDEFKIYAPQSGIVLFPEKDQSGGDAEKILTEGAEIKKDQIIVTMGETTGIATTVTVSESDINQIAAGQTAVLTSSALPGMIFYGKVVDVAKQAKTTGGSGENSGFPVQIVVPKITRAQHALVRIGMSLKVDIASKSLPEIKIPLKAVYRLHDLPTVNVIDAKTKKLRPVTVETGATGVDDVVITEGLHAGDVVKVHD